MNLPIIKHPTHKISVTSVGVIEIRPFTVKEEKILLLAKSSNSESDIIQSIKQIVNNCVISPGFDISKLPMFDLEYLFMQLRSISVDNIISLSYKDDKAKKPIIFEVNINDIVIKNYKPNNNKIDIGDGVGVILQYPSIDDFEELAKIYEDINGEGIIKLLSKFMVSVYDEDNVYEKDKDFKEKDIIEFVENLSSKSAESIANFFSNMPYLSYETEITLEDGSKKNIEIKGLQGFFT